MFCVAMRVLGLRVCSFQALRGSTYITYDSFVLDLFLIWRICGVPVCTGSGNYPVFDTHVSVFGSVFACMRVCGHMPGKPCVSCCVCSFLSVYVIMKSRPDNCRILDLKRLRTERSSIIKYSLFEFKK